MTILFDSHKIHYTVCGQGPAVVFLHGFLEDLNIWDTITAELKDHCQIICIYLPGHGLSPALKEIHSMERYAQIVHSLLATLNASTALIVGHSMGGYVALALTQQAPEVVCGLLLINTTPDKDNNARKENRNRALRIIKTQAQAFVSMAIENLCDPATSHRYVSEIAALKKRALSCDVKGLEQTIIGLRDRNDRNEILRQFQCRKHLIMGDKDPFISEKKARQINQKTGSSLTLVSGGHMTWLEAPEAIIERVKILLKA